jgi:hypothetical protein
VRFTTTSPDAVRTAAVKPAPVNSLKRSSAFKSASAFFASKLCRVYRPCDPSQYVWPLYARFRLPRKPNSALAAN